MGKTRKIKSSKSGKSRTRFVKAKCGARNTGTNYTCYDSETLHKLKTLWNARHPDAKIQTQDDKEIWKALKENMSNVCNTEKCWLRQNFSKHNISEDLRLYTFAPNSPKSWLDNPNEWLSSVDIEKVMKQYEEKHPNFVFLGPSPIDFDTHMNDDECVWKELCEFDLKDYLQKNKTKFGFIFNTDPHYSSGSHWISMFLDTNKKFIFFFDSTGEKPQKEITALIRRIQTQANDMDMSLKKIINHKSHQKGDSECGMYCLHMIISLLENKHEPNYYSKEKITDKEMEYLRDIYFNKYGI